MSKLLIAITAVVVASATADARAEAQGARWVKMNVSSYGTIWYDASHVQRSGNVATVVMRWDYAHPTHMPGVDSFDRKAESIQFDCEDRTYHEMSRTVYSGGRQLQTGDMSGSNYVHIRPGSVWAQVAAAVCT